MFDSKKITSPQSSPHKRLTHVVSKHIENRYQKPFQHHNLIAFEELQKAISEHGKTSFILDSCCGTGMSTALLAHANPNSLILGIDRSAKRLTKQSDNTLFKKPENCLYLQADCEDIWRLCVENNLVFEKHFILYPNPYPKLEHLKRRWHGHPVFPFLRKLSSEIVLRSNWKLYLEEFSLAWSLLTKSEAIEVSTLDVQKPLTLFERKYAGSGQTLYELLIHE